MTRSRPPSGPGPGCSPAVPHSRARLVVRSDGPRGASEAEEVLAGAFGPVILIRGVATPEAAVAASNASEFALGASVWGRDRRAARALGRRIQAGMVCINEAVTPTADAAAPFGGCKASGFGRTHGTLGLREFAQPQVLFERSPGGFRPQLFPYSRSAVMERFLSFYCRLFHPRTMTRTRSVGGAPAHSPDCRLSSICL